MPVTNDDSDRSPRVETGTVLACYHDEWDVALDGGEVTRSYVRARHFADLDGDQKLLAAGDRVEVSIMEDGTSVIENRLPRETVLSRVRPRMKRDVEQVIVANAEQLVVVASLAEPSLNRRFLDRYLVIAEDAELRSIVVFNKIDLVPEGEWRQDAAAYERAGYPVIPACAIDGRGVDALRSRLEDTFSVFAGASGAGKSSLLNAIEPGLGLRIREVSQATSKGKHTTSNVTVFPLDDGILVADTPGFRELGLWEIHPDDLRLFFPEFAEYAPRCRFSSCSHGPEPGCAVREAVESGDLDRGRYRSYLKLLEELRAAAG